MPGPLGHPQPGRRVGLEAPDEQRAGDADDDDDDYEQSHRQEKDGSDRVVTHATGEGKVADGYLQADQDPPPRPRTEVLVEIYCTPER